MEWNRKDGRKKRKTMLKKMGVGSTPVTDGSDPDSFSVWSAKETDGFQLRGRCEHIGKGRFYKHGSSSCSGAKEPTLLKLHFALFSSPFHAGKKRKSGRRSDRKIMY